MNHDAPQQARRTRAYLSTFTTTQLHLRNPWVSAWWSVSFPGFGNITQGRYAKGLLLVIWEMFINVKAKINLGIVYSFTGQFDKAKEVVDTRWVILYIGIYVYAIWDSYRATVDLNKQYLLADREDAPLKPIVIKTLDINYFDKRNPWVALAWSAIVPGLGYLYNHKVITGLFIFIWTIVDMYFSHIPQAIHYSALGDFKQVKDILDMQWVLYYPSVYAFVLYDSYSSSVEYNKLFEKEQSKFLRDRYQNPNFKMPL